MKVVSVLVEYQALSLNQPFSYICNEDTIQKGCRVRVNFNNRDVIGMVVDIAQYQNEEHLKPVLEILDETSLLNEELEALAQYISKEYVSSLISVYKLMLPPAYKPSSQAAKQVEEEWFELAKEKPLAPLSKKAQTCFDALKGQLPMKASLFRKKSKTLWKSMLEKGYLVSVYKPKGYNLYDVPAATKPPQLLDEQLAAIQKIETSSKQVILLHGVTGSGKTEVFLHLAAKELEKGRQVLFLVPEIALTPMMIERVTARFQQKAAIYHSGLSDQEKNEQYRLVKENKVHIVIGTRSASFLPFSNLGLILMDEEHDGSYKQDSTPRYHARDAALFRASYHHCKLLLASATPSLESYARAYKGVYELVELKNRVAKRMPVIEMVDLRESDVYEGLSQRLLDAIASRLQKKEQVILMLNRRGYYPTMRCKSCKATVTCPDCGIAMSYHKHSQSMVCHVCGNTFPFNFTCPTCGSHDFFQHGMGTERLQEVLSRFYSQAHIVRMDADTTRVKNGHAKLLKEFEEHGDILIGTQMVAKGLDFERVTLVGILNADNMMIRTDYRVAETAYEILEQASGRAGRGRLPGEVLIQTFDQENYVMQAIMQHSYQYFFRREMKYRHMGNYPPYQYLCTLVITHPNKEDALKNAVALKTAFYEHKLLGPVEISMRQKKSRFRLLIKESDASRLRDLVWQMVSWQKESHQKGKLEVNMHPLMLEE
jgi:primosomal protein N' (replication factor Y)